jgi:hypothetical protein
MSDTDNTNGSNNNNADNNTPTPDTSVPQNNPATETPASAPTTPEANTDNSAVNTTPDPVAAQTSTDTPSADTATDNVVTLRVLGSLKGEVTVPKGTRLSDAMNKVGSSTGLSLRDQNNKTVYGTTIMNDNMEVTTTQKASGG